MKKYNNNIIKVNADSEMIRPNRKEYINTAHKDTIDCRFREVYKFFRKEI